LSYSFLEEEMGDPAEVPVVLAEPDIIGIANDRARNMRDYAVFDPNAI
jgi:carbamoylphosphate synthase large subunit